MSQAEEMLNSMTEEDISLYTVDPTTEEHLIIDKERHITVPEELKRIAVQYDHNVETVSFDCPRYWDDHDLSTMYIYINYLRSDRVRGRCLAKNVAIDAEDSNTIHFDWTIGNEITLVSGGLSFLVCALQTDSDGNEEIHWNSEINNQMFVSNGLECTEYVTDEYPDIINDLFTRMDAIIAADSNILDTSLSQSGLAADAKSVGDAVARLEATSHKKPYCFDTIHSIEVNELKDGDLIMTSGYHSKNDKGGAIYTIRTKTEDDMENEGLIHVISDTLVAELVIENDMINILQLGYRPDDPTQDIKPAFDLINKLSIDNDKPMGLYIPIGHWYTSPVNLTATKGVKIIGDGGKCYVREGYNTVLNSFMENQQHILKVGNDTVYTENYFTRALDTKDLCCGYQISNLSFCGSVVESALTLVGVCYSQIGDLSFRKVSGGHSMLVSSCWEINFGKIYFRNIYSTKDCLFFDQIAYGGNYNCSALYFEYLSFEAINGTCIGTTDYSFVITNTFNAIDFEQRWYDGEGTTQKPATDDIINNYIFNGYFDMCTINSINVYINEEIYNLINDKWYRLKAVFSDTVTPIRPTQALLGVRNYLAVGEISLYNEAKEFYMAHSVNSQRGVSSLAIGCLNLYDNAGGIYDSYDGFALKIGVVNGRNVNVLNTLMDKITIKATSIDTKPNATLTKTDDAIDVSGCVLKINNAAAPGIPIKGTNTLKIWARVAFIDEKGLREDTPATITLRTYSQNSLGADSKQKTLTYKYTNGIEALTFEGLEVGIDNYMTLTCSNSDANILIYRIEL